ADTPVLYADLSWRPIGNIQVGDVIAGFDERPEPGRTRKLRMAVVEAVRRSRRPTLRLICERSAAVAAAEHLWLQDRNSRWTRTDGLVSGRHLRHVPLAAAETNRRRLPRRLPRRSVTGRRHLPLPAGLAKQQARIPAIVLAGCTRRRRAAGARGRVPGLLRCAGRDASILRGAPQPEADAKGRDLVACPACPPARGH